MRKLILVTFTLLFLAGSTLCAGAKRYNIKSGSISYRTSTSGSIMGIGTQSEGSKTLYFKEYGNVEVQETSSTSNTMGRQEKTHTLTKFQNGMIYTVNFDKETIIKQDMSAIMGDKNMQAMGAKMWFYKGVPLKMESNMMGIKTSEIATKASFNKSIPNSKFNLPKYPVQTMDDMMQGQRNRHDTSANKPNPEQMQQVQYMLKGLGGLLGGQQPIMYRERMGSLI